MALLALAGLSGAAIYWNAGGPAGGLIRGLARLAVGRLDVVVPVLGVLAGGLVAVAAARKHAGRILTGCGLCLIALAGMVHLSARNKPLATPLEKLQHIGGLLGALAARPLSDLTAAWCAWLALLCLLGLGVMVVSRTPPRTVYRYLGAGAGAALAFARGLVAGRNPVGYEQVEGEEEEDEHEPEHQGEEEEEPQEVARLAGPRPPGAATVGDAGKPARLAVLGSRSGYSTPPLELLATGEEREVSARSIEDTIRMLETTLEQFNVDAVVTGYAAGPTVTRFEIELGAGVKVNRVLSLGNEIKYALASGELRFLAPIPGRSAIGVEVPNRTRQLVTLGDVLRSKEAQKERHPLVVALGQGISGEPVMANLAEMPHLLIAGATNSGKSSCINSMITSILVRAHPDRVRMILIDPKRVELTHFAGVPHLLTPVVTAPKKAAGALGWVVREMETRYERLAHFGMRNLDFYNDAIRRGAVAEGARQDLQEGLLPYILVVIDELSDLMMVAPRDVESAICRIAQMARAVGIHLVVATQRPSVDVVTGLIKANIPSRLAFSVASQQDSRVILDQGGADKLIGNGDMLFLHANSSKPRRIQGAWVSEKEIAAVTGHVRRQVHPEYVEGVVPEQGGAESDEQPAGGDELLEEALELVVRSRLGSTSMLQRKLKVGFARAGRLMDLLEQRGIVGPSLGSKPRDVLMTVEELEAAQESSKEAE